MTITKIEITINLFGEGKKDIVIPIKLETLQDAMKLTSNQSRPEGLWLYIQSYYNALKNNGLLEDRD